MDSRIVVVDMELRGEAFAARIAELLGPLDHDIVVVTHQPPHMIEDMAELVRLAEAARHSPIVVFDDADLLEGEVMREYREHRLRLRMEEDLHRAMARALTKALTKEPHPQEEKGWYRKFERRRLR